METVTIKSVARCNKCDKFKVTSVDKKVGDLVNYQKSTTTGNRTRLSVHMGKIVDIYDGNVVVKGRGRAGNLHFSADRLTDPDGASSLSVALIGQCECEVQ